MSGTVGPQGPPGVSVTGASFSSTGDLLFTLSNGTVLDAGPLPSGSGGGTGTGTGGPVAPLLQMPTGITGGAPVTIGTGPNTLVLNVSNDNTPPDCTFSVVINNVAITGPLDISAYVATQSAGQTFTINMTLGLAPYVVQLVAGPSGMQGAIINLVTLNGVPFVTQTQTDSRGSQNVNAYSTFISNDAPVTIWTVPIAVVAPPPPPPPATLSQIAATVNGVAKTDTLANLLTDTPTGGKLILPAGTFAGTGNIPNAITVIGAGMGKTIINGLNVEPSYDKALFVPQVHGTILEKMTLENAAISVALGNNAAGVRDNGAGIGCNLTNVEITGCQDGILTSGGSWNLTGCKIHNNGYGDGYTHEMYFNDDVPTNTITLTNVTSTQGMLSTHALKSRAGTTHVIGGTYTSGGNSNGNICGSLVDFPQGGVFTASGATFILLNNSANTMFFGYAEENSINLAIGTTATFTNCIFTDETGTGGSIQNGGNIPTATLVLVGCTYTGTVAPNISGFATVTGTITKAA